jgi:DNA polymerase-3 subunit epsilon
MREVVLDTETTGLDPAAGHRIVEIGCLEIVNRIATGRTFQRYLNPERDVPEEAVRIHGITADKLSGKPLFADVVEELMAFLGESRLVIHNALFDLGFLNAELGRLGLPEIPAGRAIDTIELARRKFPGAPASLDALCKRFDIDTSARSTHGALLDAALLAEVYVGLVGGRQARLALNALPAATGAASAPAAHGPRRPQRPHQPTAEEAAAHRAFVDGLSDPIWRR